MNPRSAKIAVISSITWLTGWIDPCAAGRPGSVTSAHSAATRASSAASASRALASASASASSSLSALSAGPATCRSSGGIAPSPRISPETSPFLPSAATPHRLERRLVGGLGDRGHVLLANSGGCVHLSPSLGAWPRT